MAKPALGRGLGALLGSVPARTAPLSPVDTSPPLPAQAGTASPGQPVRQVPLERVRPSLLQPRKEFSQEALQELAESIRQQGIIQPLIVRETGTHLELIAGERRWRAAALAGIKEVPVIVRETDDAGLLELALIENLQRENLNPLEEAVAYSQLISQFNLRQEDAAAKVGKSRAVVANALRLLKLDPAVQTYLRDGRLSVGHAKVILSLENSTQQKVAAERIVKETLSVRQAEDLVARLQGAAPAAVQAPHPGKNGGAKPADPNIHDLENRLRERLGTKIQLRYRQGKGSLEIRFFSDDELERLLQILGVQVE